MYCCKLMEHPRFELGRPSILTDYITENDPNLLPLVLRFLPVLFFTASLVSSLYAHPGIFGCCFIASSLLLLLSLLPAWHCALCADSASWDDAYMRGAGSGLEALKCCWHWTEVILLSAKRNVKLGGSRRADGPPHQ